MDAFVSHSSAQLAIAKRIERALEKDGLAVWIDDAEIQPGQLLRDQLTDAIRGARTFVLVWSKEAAKSRWVCAELLTAFHLDRPIIPCSSDNAALPEFLSNLLCIDVSAKTRSWPRVLVRTVRDAPPHAFEPIVMTGQGQELREVLDSLAAAQQRVVSGLVLRDLAAAREAHAVVERALVPARRRWPYDAELSNIAGYHAKNGYLLKHWDRIQAGLTPADVLLKHAERAFFRSLFVDPYDASALNGLASILMLEHELHAAAFFNARALQLSRAAGVDYPAAEHDRATIEYYLTRSANLSGRPAK